MKTDFLTGWDLCGDCVPPHEARPVSAPGPLVCTECGAQYLPAEITDPREVAMNWRHLLADRQLERLLPDEVPEWQQRTTVAWRLEAMWRHTDQLPPDGDWYLYERQTLVGIADTLYAAELL